MLPATIGERDVFYSEEEALDAVDLHYAWCSVQNGPEVATAQWYLQSAMVGPRISPALGEVYLAVTDTDSGDAWAVAGGFLTEGELVHWAPFVHAVKPFIPVAPGVDSLGLAYRGDTEVYFQQMWFAPMHSRRVFPKPIVVEEDSGG